jgi:hypothetical protein
MHMAHCRPAKFGGVSLGVRGGVGHGSEESFCQASCSITAEEPALTLPALSPLGLELNHRGASATEAEDSLGRIGAGLALSRSG